MAANIPQPTNEQELGQVLAMLMAPDNEQIKQASSIMKVFLKKADCVQPLVAQIASSPEVAARQMAAVLLRRKIGVHIRHLPAPVINQIKAQFLDRLVNENMRLVRISIASLISALAKKIVPDGQWPELLSFLLQCFESAQPGHREVAMMLFRALAENIGETLKPHFPELQKIFMRGMQDTNENVRMEALKAVGVLVEYLETDEEVVQFRHIVPHMVEVVKKSIASGDEEAAAITFEVFDMLAESPAPVINVHIPILIQLMAEVMVSNKLGMNIREKASLFVVSVIESKPGKIVKHNLVQPLLQCCFQLCEEPFEDSFEVGEMTPQKLAVEILDALALNTPKQQLYDASMQQVQTLLGPGKGEHQRKGGLVIIAVLAEGLAELFKPNLEGLVQVICQSTKDPSANVRSAAAVALTQFSDYLQPEILDFHSVILPHVFQLLSSPTETNGVKRRTCTAVEVFTEQLGKDLLPFVRPLMEMLVGLLQSGDTTLQESAISAIKSVARAAQEEFVPYFPDTIRFMGEIMTQTKDTLLDLRSQATECAGAIALAVGKETFAPFLNDFVKLAIEGCKLNYFQLREACHTFFSSIALLLATDFHVLLGLVMPLLVASCTSDDGVVIHNDKEGLDGNDPDGIGSDSEEEDDDDTNGRRMKFSIRSGALDEKVAAVTTIGTICSVVGEAIMPYLEKTLTALDELCEYPHHFIRASVMGTFQEIFSLLHTCRPNAIKASAGVATDLHPHTKAVVDKVVPMLINRMLEEEEKTVAAAACEALVEAGNNFGLGAFQDNIDEIYQATLELVSEKSSCQQAYDDDDPESTEHDEVLIDSVTDVVGVLAQVVGNSFEPIFRQMFPHIMKFCKPQRPYSDRSMAIGCIAEVAEVIGKSMGDYLQPLFPVVINSLNDTAVEVRRNSAFCLGVICSIGSAEVVRAYPACVDALEVLFNIGEPSKHSRTQIIATRDNACSAICKMITTNAGAVPLDKVVRLLLSGLPLTEDLAEAKHVYPAVMFLVEKQPQMMAQHIPALVNMFTQVLGTEAVEDEVKAKIAAFCPSLRQFGANPQLENTLQQLQKHL